MSDNYDEVPSPLTQLNLLVLTIHNYIRSHYILSTCITTYNYSLHTLHLVNVLSDPALPGLHCSDHVLEVSALLPHQLKSLMVTDCQVCDGAAVSTT